MWIVHCRLAPQLFSSPFFYYDNWLILMHLSSPIHRMTLNENDDSSSLKIESGKYMAPRSILKIVSLGVRIGSD
jgi:hypothetical protein